MAENYFEDNPCLQQNLESGLGVIAEKDEQYDASDYTEVLKAFGELCAEEFGPHTVELETEPPKLEDGKIVFPGQMQKALDILKRGDYTKFIVPIEYDGLGLPYTVFAAACEMVSRASPSLMTLFALQGIAHIITKSRDEELMREYLPRIAAGEGCAMALTEPEAGSDLLAMTTRAEKTEDGWKLNGVKHFITNGGADINLVYATRDPTLGGRGISTFIVEGKDIGTHKLEEKIGLHGSPTAELLFQDTPARLVGNEKLGGVYMLELLKYGRLAIAAQAVGTAERAIREADGYSKTRRQFKKPIAEIPRIQQYLDTMRTELTESRCLLYDASMALDTGDRAATLLTYKAKLFATEAGFRICDKALQIHGGNGYMKEYPISALWLASRVMRIYEGTSEIMQSEIERMEQKGSG